MVITKLGMCCLNCLNISYTKICPTAFMRQIITMLANAPSWIQSQRKVARNCPIPSSRTKETRQEQRFIEQQSSMLVGLYSALICAWMSGTNPSQAKDINSPSELKEMRVKGLSSSCCQNLLKHNIPAQAMPPIQIFYLPILAFLSLTFEQRVPTRMTERRLHDFVMAMTGKDEYLMAELQEKEERLRMHPTAIEFFQGSLIADPTHVRMVLPISAQNKCDKKLIMRTCVKYSFCDVYMFRNGLLSLRVNASIHPFVQEGRDDEADIDAAGEIRKGSVRLYVPDY